MDVNSQIVNAFVGAAAIASVSTSALAAEAASPAMEKCYGVVKAGKNDCANLAGTHSCAGKSTIDGDKGEWLLLPAGTCERLVSSILDNKLGKKS